MHTVILCWLGTLVRIKLPEFRHNHWDCVDVLRDTSFQKDKAGVIALLPKNQFKWRRKCLGKKIEWDGLTMAGDQSALLFAFVYRWQLEQKQASVIFWHCPCQQRALFELKSWEEKGTWEPSDRFEGQESGEMNEAVKHQAVLDRDPADELDAGVVWMNLCSFRQCCAAVIATLLCRFALWFRANNCQIVFLTCVQYNSLKSRSWWSWCRNQSSSAIFSNLASKLVLASLSSFWLLACPNCVVVSEEKCVEVAT